MRSPDYFIKKFDSIPETEWILDNGINYRHAAGLCDPGTPFQGKQGHWWPEPDSERQDLGTLLWIELQECISDINDGKSKKFKQTTPKSRILAALNLIKANNEH